MTEYGGAGLQATLAFSAAFWGEYGLATNLPNFSWTLVDDVVRGIGGAVCPSSLSLPQTSTSAVGLALRWGLSLSPLLIGGAAAYLGGKFSFTLITPASLRSAKSAAGG
uniref:Uncharacterized protein n=1 Tax=Chromera velia CCMP2878 TaxID=1169474 RepID=A0A0G4GA31_9ALVE|eukprot:Cvel_20826.t1-p1 / transcript=Cvel_20826.t1 / gene=Cvel_20826 / organism=Chromera_velia_CCMP2878 / gene_product=hypothetical protein / transcript_product=hypothetical protein / location=Cvel_scaffold1905:2822-5368(+) / protein_length=108 / sequence_SO=supercontig / SO=protein_coding / is_pseudo=false